MQPPSTVRVAIASDPFVIEAEAGSGGMGTVYRARDRATGRLVAVKVLNDRSGDPTRFALEADVLSKLRHPAIVGYEHHGLTKDGHPYLAMEWLEGESLEHRLERGVVPLDEALRIARTIADALDVAHDAGIIHRDLKPSNVFMTSAGEVKLLDFGVAKSVAVEGLTQSGQALGTPGYMAPEQARGARVDARADLFALGCLVFRCVGGRRPFEGSDILTFATKLALEDAPPLRSVAPGAPVALEALVTRLLEKDPERRPSRAALVRDEIDRLRAALCGAEPTLPVAQAIRTRETRTPVGAELARPTTERASRPSRAPWLVGGVAVVAIAAAAIYLTRRPSEEPRAAAAGSAPSASAVASAPAPSAAASESTSAAPADAPLVDADARTALDGACRNWGDVLARAQRPDGAFAAGPQRDPTGWDTAQALYALAEARRACNAVGVAPLAAGARALERLRGEDGWHGATKPGPLENAAETPADAWAALAFARLREATPSDPAMTIFTLRGRADVLAAGNDDGGFRYRAKEAGASSTYATVLAAWALLETRAVDGGAAAEDERADQALAWLRRDVIAAGPASREIGVAEPVAFVLARAARRGAHGQADADALRAAAARVVEHCRLEGDACKRPAPSTGRVVPAEGAPPIVAEWLPWETAAAYELARDAALPIEPDARRDLAAVARWGIKELRAASPEPSKLTAYVLAASRLLEAP